MGEESRVHRGRSPFLTNESLPPVNKHQTPASTRVIQTRRDSDSEHFHPEHDILIRFYLNCNNS